MRPPSKGVGVHVRVSAAVGVGVSVEGGVGVGVGVGPRLQATNNVVSIKDTMKVTTAFRLVLVWRIVFVRWSIPSASCYHYYSLIQNPSSLSSHHAPDY